MAHWYHRNPLKATSPVTFDLRGAAKNSQSQKICSDLHFARTQLLDIISNANNEVSTVTSAANNYFALLQGFITSQDPDKSSDSSKLRHAIRFRWTNTLLGNTPTEVYDAMYEQISMLFNVALWYTKHAAKLAGKEEPTMEEAKEVHRCLRVAAGIFTYMNAGLVGRLLDQPEKGSDLDSRVLNAYIQQCQAEAQEVTIARAIELKHNSSIIASLAFETAKMFTGTSDALTSLDEKTIAKWKKYLQFKMHIYFAYAYSYHGDMLLAQDKCGEAIKCLEESKQNYEKAEKLGREYGSAQGPGTSAKPHEHLFFRKLGPVINRTLDKCVRENGFIYHQKVPTQVPGLELKATYGLVAPEEFAYPAASALWTKDAYDGFDISAIPKPDDKEKLRDKSGDIKPVKEADVPLSNKDPKNSSGCVMS